MPSLRQPAAGASPNAPNEDEPGTSTPRGSARVGAGRRGSARVGAGRRGSARVGAGRRVGGSAGRR
ncbi:hypothetical protein, partial [Micromonospora sediminimaris]|uniref:hypothetical protein n=1 Tax=Micromonospora sediminimaris TaxID=547162 RepID=UPI00194DE31C